jgi:hypothetical protein
MNYLFKIKNAMRVAVAAAAEEGSKLSFSHLHAVIEPNEEFENDFRGAGQMDDMNSYM